MGLNPYSYVLEFLRADFLSIFDIISDAMSENISPVSVTLSSNKEGLVTVLLIDALEYSFEKSIPYMNMLRKWNKFCASFDFKENQAQFAFNGLVSNIVKPEFNCPNYNGTFDGNKISMATPNENLTLKLGAYYFDNNPFIGYMININAWDRTMKQEGIDKIDHYVEGFKNYSIINFLQKLETYYKIILN